MYYILEQKISVRTAKTHYFIYIPSNKKIILFFRNIGFNKIERKYIIVVIVRFHLFLNKINIYIIKSFTPRPSLLGICKVVPVPGLKFDFYRDRDRDRDRDWKFLWLVPASLFFSSILLHIFIFLCSLPTQNP
jgi:hypothetical protein